MDTGCGAAHKQEAPVGDLGGNEAMQYYFHKCDAERRYIDYENQP